MMAEERSEILLAIGKLNGELAALHTRVGEHNSRMVEGFTELKTDIQREMAAQTTRLNKHSERIDGIEKMQSRFLGGLAILSAIGASLWAWLTKGQ